MGVLLQLLKVLRVTGLTVQHLSLVVPVLRVWYVVHLPDYCGRVSDCPVGGLAAVHPGNHGLDHPPTPFFYYILHSIACGQLGFACCCFFPRSLYPYVLAILFICCDIGLICWSDIDFSIRFWVCLLFFLLLSPLFLGVGGR